MRILMLIVVLAIAGVAVAQDAVVIETPAGETAVAAEAEAAVESEVVEEVPAVDAYAEANDIMLHLCMECHGDVGHDAGFKLPTTREGTGMVDVPSIQRTDLMLIDPGHPETSYLNMKLKADPGILGKQMPIVRLLSEEQIAMFDLWVTELAPPEAEPVEESEEAAAAEKPEKTADCDEDGDEDVGEGGDDVDSHDDHEDGDEDGD